MIKTPSKEYDVLVVGAGIVGAALGYGLAGKGLRVGVLDAPTPVNNASRANVGLVWCQSKGLHAPDYAKWGFLSARLYPALVKELEDVSGLSIPATFPGGVIPVLGEEDYNKREQYIAGLRDVLGDYSGYMIGRAELERRLPHLPFGPEVTGAAWGSEDGMVEPLLLLRAFHVALLRSGLDLRQNTFVYEVNPIDGGYRVTTNQGPLTCERLVLAAGLANRRLAQCAMPSIPVYPDKGQVLLVERLPMVMPIPVLGVTQTFGGTVIIGFKHEKAGHASEVVPEVVATEGRWAMRVWPELGNRRVIRAWSGLRVMPDDGLPIYSRLPGHPKLVLVNTHSGLTLTAAHARLLSEYILGGELPGVARSMTLSRFGFSAE